MRQQTFALPPLDESSRVEESCKAEKFFGGRGHKPLQEKRLQSSFVARLCLAAAILACVTCLACDKTEIRKPTSREASSVADAKLQQSAAPDAPAAPAAPAAACVVPTPEEPAPEAKPAAQCPVAPTPAPVLQRAFVTFLDAEGAPRVSVENAVTNAEHARGLMYRTSMPENEGMLFSWRTPQPRSFWMHNTCIPLDMLFIAKDGTIAGILEQVPVLNDSPRGVRCPAQYVLEMNAGWTRKNGVKAGQRVKIEP